jgi:protein-tyrosine-phosphatase
MNEAKTVLFMCPHSAAKSVLASAYFNARAQARGLHYTADFAGTDPDESISPVVLDIMRMRGLPLPAHGPRKVTPADVQHSAQLVSIGCDLGELLTPEMRLETWVGVPNVSEDAGHAAAALFERVETLLDRLQETDDEMDHA